MEPLEKPTFIASPNFSLRKSPKIDMIIIHATGDAKKVPMGATVNTFKDPKSGVSAHYVIDRDATIVQMVELQYKAWHAGISSWEGKQDVGSRSVGIELVNLNDGADPYPDEQLQALVKLCKTLMKALPDITLDKIVGHCHVAPGRKTDPGPIFPWVKFGAALGEALNG